MATTLIHSDLNSIGELQSHAIELGDDTLEIAGPKAL